MRSLAFIVALAGCGFTGEKPFADKRQPDVAPWQDLGPVVFCQGQTRIGVPSSKAGGICLGGRQLKSCAADADCASREACNCGRCMIMLCDAADECRGDKICSFADRRCDKGCDKDSDCGSNEFCLPGTGVCRGKCGSDADCQGGETCQMGQCVSEACATDADCFNSPTCSPQRIPGTLKEPSPLVDDKGNVIMYVERVDNMTSTIWRATSADGIFFKFDPETPVVTPDASDNNRAGAPSVLATTTDFTLVYANGSGQLRLSMGSSDGVHWPKPMATQSPASTWEQSGLDAPSIVAASPEGLVAYYGTVDRSAVGVATINIASAALVGAPDPLLRPTDVADPSLWRNLDAIGSPFGERGKTPDGKDFVRLWFAARGQESMPSVQFGKMVEETPNFSVGEAATLDGKTFVPYPYDPVFDRVLNFLDHPNELDPAVVTVGNRRLLYYRGAAADGTKPSNIGVAQNPVPVAP